MTAQRYSTGIKGLDEVLHGGLLPGRGYLVRGGPGSGKTALGMHFLEEGASAADPALFVTLGEQADNLKANAEAMGIDTTGIDILDLSPDSSFFAEDQAFDVLTSDQVDQDPIIRAVREEIDNQEPVRVFIDSLTQLRYLSRDTYQFRKQALSFIRFLTEKGATVLFSSEASDEAPDDDLAFLADGVLNLNADPASRRIAVTKFRGSGFRSGSHAVSLGDDGMSVHPQLVPEEHSRPFQGEVHSSGVPELDEMLHGGIEAGTTTIVSGPTGVGKSTIASLFLKEAAARGERSQMYLFDEDRTSLLNRTESVQIPLAAMEESGQLAVEKVEPLTHSAESFAQRVRQAVETDGARLVMLDSLRGYRMALHGEETLDKLHALVRYLSNMGVTVVLPMEVDRLTGDLQVSDEGASYLADNVIILRYLEIDGELRRAMGVLKKRLSNFDKRLREYEITAHGVRVGPPLSGMQGLLGGVPEPIAKDGGGQ